MEQVSLDQRFRQGTSIMSFHHLELSTRPEVLPLRVVWAVVLVATDRRHNEDRSKLQPAATLSVSLEKTTC